MGLIGIILFGLFGVVLLVYGYPMFRLLLPIFGFMLGFIVGSALIPPEQWLLMLIISVGLAIGLAALAFAAWSLVLGLAGVIFGAGLGLGLGVALGGNGHIMAIAGAVLFGLLFFRLRNLMVILLTAYNGAWMVVAAVAELLGQEDMITRTQRALNSDLGVFTPNWIIVIAVVVVGIIGVVVQYRMFGTRDTYSSFDV